MKTTSLLALLLALTLLAPQAVLAFSLETAATEGCHERITLSALERAGWPLEVALQLPPAVDPALAQSLPFRLPQGANLWHAALLVGVRDNDLHGAAPAQLPELAAVHQSEVLQHEHCLRAPAQDFEAGDVAALEDCRAFILREVEAALGQAEQLEPGAQESVRVSLAWQTRSLQLPRVAFRLGRALHALQDSYTHTFRSPEDLRIRHVFNYVDTALAPQFDQARDGHAHVSEFDRCDGATEGSRRRTQAAVEASALLLAAVANPEGGRAGRLARVQAVLEQSLAYEPGCTAEGGWCGLANEAVESASGCSSAPGAGSGLGLMLAGLALLGRRAWRAPRRLSAAGAAMVAVALLAAPRAWADELAMSGGEAQGSGWRLHAAMGAGVDRGGANLTLGVMRDASPRLQLGLAAEFNPWFDLLAARASPGVLNAYGVASWRWASVQGLELRSSARLGASMLLFDMVGARSGSVGPYLGLRPLSVSWQVSRGLRMEVAPAELALAVPQVRGVPVAYHQYRFTVGVDLDI